LPVYSHSRLGSYENCPLAYKYRYIDRIRTGWQSIEAFMGKCAHEVLEALYGDIESARKDGPEPWVEKFDAIWNSKLTSDVHVVRPDLDPEYYRELGAACVKGYWERHHPFPIDPKSIIGLELKVEMALDPDRRYRMMGFIDRAQHAEPGVIEIHDYKTSSSLPREGSLRYDRQLPLYEIALRQRFPQTQKVRLIWHYLAHNKEFVEERHARDLDRVKKQCIDLIRTVEAARDFPAKKGPLCSWCEFQDRCPEWKDAKPMAAPAFPNGRPAPPPGIASGEPRQSAVKEERPVPRDGGGDGGGREGGGRKKPSQLRLF